MKKFIAKLFKPLFEEIMKESLHQELEKLVAVDPPRIKRIKQSFVLSGRKPTVWEILDSGAASISLCIRWVDKHGLGDFTSYTANDIADLKHIMKTLKPREEMFSSVSIHVKPMGSSTSVIEHLVKNSPTNEKHYLSSDLKNVFEPTIEWIDERPELLI